MQITPRVLVGLFALLVSRPELINAAVPNQVGEAVEGNYLAEEKIQLTASSAKDLEELDSKHAALFYPEDEKRKRGIGLLARSNCKTFPGDARWPEDDVWKFLDRIAGGALIKTVPISASCYDSFGVKNEARCRHIVDQWSNSSLQSVSLDSYPLHGHH
ncbi:hypothetical protein SNK03_009285 [Fusarium graminearum]